MKGNSQERISPKIPTILGEISMAILSLLRDRPGLTWGQIIKDLKRNRDTVGPKISKLVKKGYIRKDSNRYYLTPFSDLMFEKALTVDSGVIEISDQRVKVSPDQRLTVSPDQGVKVSPGQGVTESPERATVKEVTVSPIKRVTDFPGKLTKEIPWITETPTKRVTVKGATVKGVTVSPGQQLPGSPDQRVIVSPAERVTVRPDERATVKEATVKEATVKGATVKGATVKGATVKGATVKGATVSPIKRVTDIPAKEVTDSPNNRGKHKHALYGFTLILYEFVKSNEGISTEAIRQHFNKKSNCIRSYLYRLKDYGYLRNDSGKWYLASKGVTEIPGRRATKGVSEVTRVTGVTEIKSKVGRPKKSISGFTLVLYEFVKKNEGLDTGAISQRLGKGNDSIRHYLNNLKNYGHLINDSGKWYQNS